MLNLPAGFWPIAIASLAVGEGLRPFEMLRDRAPATAPVADIFTGDSAAGMIPHYVLGAYLVAMAVEEGLPIVPDMIPVLGGIDLPFTGRVEAVY
jgi:hypothetical protein